MTDELLQLHPAWRQALKLFLAAGFTPGHTIEAQWFYDALSVEMPAPTTPLAQAQKSKLLFLSGFTKLAEVLLDEHQVALANVTGVGYRIVPPGEQTDWADGEGVRDLRRGMKRVVARLANVDLRELTADQRRENADAMAKWARLRDMARDVLPPGKHLLTDEREEAES